MYPKNFSRRIRRTLKLISNVFMYVFHPKVNTVNDTNKPTYLDPTMIGRTRAVEMCIINYKLRMSPILVVQYTYDFVWPTIFLTNHINDLTITGWQPWKVDMGHLILHDNSWKPLQLAWHIRSRAVLDHINRLSV